MAATTGNSVAPSWIPRPMKWNRSTSPTRATRSTPDDRLRPAARTHVSPEQADRLPPGLQPCGPRMAFFGLLRRFDDPQPPGLGAGAGPGDEPAEGERSLGRMANDAKRYRTGLRVGTSITEGSGNLLVNRRMNKPQQMRWSRR